MDFYSIYTVQNVLYFLQKDSKIMPLNIYRKPHFYKNHVFNILQIKKNQKKINLYISGYRTASKIIVCFIQYLLKNLLFLTKKKHLKEVLFILTKSIF